MQQPNWLDRTIGFFSPRSGLERLRARTASTILARHYEGAAAGRRTSGWNRSSGDANTLTGPALARLRDAARDLVRNNGHAKSALRTIVNHVVGWGIVAKPNPASAKLAKVWKAWAETTACDSDGRNDFYGLQKLAMRTVAESGEVLIRRRIRFPDEGLPLPLQLQVLDPDYLDTSLNSVTRNPDGLTVSRIINGIEYDILGKRTAYWLFSEHPGSNALAGIGSARRVPAEFILHVYDQDRPGQVRGVSWFAPVLLQFKDFDEFADATLMKQKIAACLAVITSDIDGSAPPLGTLSTSGEQQLDSLEPGAIVNVSPGRSIQVVQPPTVREYADYAATTLRAIATGLGVTYEDLTGDYGTLSFSAARMSRLSHWSRVEDWRWRILIPQLCDPVWRWAMDAAAIMLGDQKAATTIAEWTPPPAPMVDPVNEGLAYQRNIRTGIQTLSEALRERGYDPNAVLAERAKDDATLDRLGLTLDSDPRRTTQAGNAVTAPAADPAAADPTMVAADGEA